MKKVVIGIMLSLLCVSSFAYADDTGKNIIVHDDTIKKIIIDGVDKTPIDENPFVYEGTTYVPLSYIAEELGKEVNWDGNTGTVYLGKIPESTSTESNYLTDKKNMYYSNVHLYRINNNSKKNLNLDKDACFDYPDDFKMSIMVDPANWKVEEYEKGISIKAYDDTSRLIYNLNKRYNKLTGILGFDEILNEKSDENYIVRFIVDDKMKQEVELKREGFCENVDIDVSNGKQLEIQFVRPEGNKEEPFINLVDMILE